MIPEKKNKKRILIAIDWFDPAFRAGGPVKSVLNICVTLSNEFEFFIFTGNTDVGSTGPLAGVEYNKWILHPSGAMVYYSDISGRSRNNTGRVLQELKPDWIYLNSMFSGAFTLNFILNAKRLSISRKVILAPRGMLKSSALGQKALKKKAFLYAFRLLGLNKNIRYQATNEQEADEIRTRLHSNNICTVPNLTVSVSSRPALLQKSPGQLSILLVGRIHPIKNILGAVRAVSALSGEVEFKIVGVMEDERYWQSCLDVIRRTPESIKIDYVGEVPPNKLKAFYERCHVFLLPTLGENFGHAIVEALGSGRPVLISDNTPWNDLSAVGAGWNFPVDAISSFTDALQLAVQWDQSEFETVISQVFLYLNTRLNMNNTIARYRELFN